MQYEGIVYRPPSEAYSLIIQLTIGCAHNHCTFCSMYKGKQFRIRPLDEVIADLEECRRHYGAVRRIFLADGDALIVKTPDLLYILDKIKEIFPEVERVTMYAAPRDILNKSPEDLQALHQAGLDMVYVGAESGDDQTLTDIKKGVTAAQVIEAGQKVRAAGIRLSMTLISGLGGRKRLKEHAIASAQLISAIKPEYVGFLTLMVEPGTELYGQVERGEFDLITPPEVLEEMKLFLTHVDSEGTVFRANHASNYVNLAGDLNMDKPLLLRRIMEAEKHRDYKPETWRAL